MNIVFDIGNVLIRWRPELAFADRFPDPAAALAWLDAIGFEAWNLLQDGGRPLAEGLAALEAAHPGAGPIMAGYPARFGDTIREPVAGTWALLDRLAVRGHRLFAITNFAVETWPVALEVHPRLGRVFEDVVVSGYERLLKPDPAIYRVLLARNRISAADCLFIDDRAENVAGAVAVGMAGHRFQDPRRLADDLDARGLL